MRYRRWLFVYFGTIFVVVFAIGVFNYAVDPLWTFCHSYRFNNAQPGFDERQQKTNRAYFCGLGSYDTLLLGSSRTTYIDQHDFAPLKVFNYASVAMYPDEYEGWIEVAETIKGKPFDTIILGMDFFGSNDGPFARQQMRQSPPPRHYLDVAKGFLYRYTMLLSKETFEKSLEALRHATHPGTTDYSRDNVKHTIHISKERKARVVAQQHALYASQVYGAQYRYNTALEAQLRRLKRRHPGTRFIVFTTPISADLFDLLVKSGRYEDYKRWLCTLVKVFGEVYDFMGYNSVTQNPDAYADLHHIYPEVGRWLARRIVGAEDADIPKDFGVRIDKANCKTHFETIEKTLRRRVKGEE